MSDFMGVSLNKRSATIEKAVTLRTRASGAVAFDVLSLITTFTGNRFYDQSQRYGFQRSQAITKFRCQFFSNFL